MPSPPSLPGVRPGLSMRRATQLAAFGLLGGCPLACGLSERSAAVDSCQHSSDCRADQSCIDDACVGNGGTREPVAPEGGAGGTRGGTGGSPSGGSHAGGKQPGSDVGGAPTAGASGSGGAAAMAGGGGAAAMAGGGGVGGGRGGTGAGGNAECVDPPPCGGDVVGTWAAVASCELRVGGMADLMSVGLGCASAPVTGWLRVSGTWVAMGDGTYLDHTITTGEAILALAQECLMISGFMTSCDRIDSALASLGLYSTVCVDDPETNGCTCTATIEQSGGLASISAFDATNGTYTTADTALVVTSSGVDTEYRYCVDGNTLTMAPGTANAVGTLTGPVVLQRQ